MFPAPATPRLLFSRSRSAVELPPGKPRRLPITRARLSWPNWGRPQSRPKNCGARSKRTEAKIGDSGGGAMKRLGSLMEVASLAETANDFGTAVVEFLDQFNIEGNPAMVSDEPPLLRTQLGDNGPADAYLAAVALHLSRVIGEIPPAWIVR